MRDEVLPLIFLLGGAIVIPAVVVSVTRAAAAGKLGVNAVAGIRTRHTTTSEAAWRAAHAAALPRVSTLAPIAVGTLLAAVAVTVLGDASWGLGVATAGFVAEMVVVISALGPANAAAREAGNFHVES